MSKKILFMTRGKGIVDMFWSEEARKRAQQYGYQVDIPAADGDILDFDFTPILSEYDGLITSWGSPMCSKEFLSHAPNVKVIGHSAGSVAAITDATTYECDVPVQIQLWLRQWLSGVYWVPYWRQETSGNTPNGRPYLL